MCVRGSVGNCLLAMDAAVESEHQVEEAELNFNPSLFINLE